MHIFVNQSYDWLISLSIHVSLLVSLVILLRRVFNTRLAPGWSYPLWIILILSLVLPNPVSIQLPSQLQSSQQSYLIASSEEKLPAKHKD